MRSNSITVVIGGRRRGPGASKRGGKRGSVVAVRGAKPLRVKLGSIDGKTQLSEGYATAGQGQGGLGTGGVLWDSALFLARWIKAARGKLFAAEGGGGGRSVLELGSGLGLPGIVAAACAPASSCVVLTDCVAEVLATLDANVRANAVASGASAVAVELDWRELDAGAQRIIEASGGGDSGDDMATAERVTFDVLLAADLIYMVEMATLLADVICRFLAPNGVVLAIFPANRHGVEEFFAIMEERGFVCEVGPPPAACVGPAMSVRWCPGKHRCCVLYRQSGDDGSGAEEGGDAQWSGLLE